MSDSLDIGDMLRDHDNLVSHEATTIGGSASAEIKGEHPGEVLGVYTLIERLGEGGFGTVWAAEQSTPLRRRVALKILKMGMDTREVIARFEQERQALAVMDHPNIARVLDAGATPRGRPYFVMELVRGTSITRFCDEKRLGTPERLRLFIEVCQAVQHAHQKGIIHRDLKPTNILVSEHEGRAQVKVIDFGIAKATGIERLTDLTIVTLGHRLIGTPAYMSPEQLIGANDVDTRADIYSLGVVLYELLTGTTPFDASELAAAGRDGMIRLLVEKPAPKLATRVRTLDATALRAVAEARRAKPAEFQKLLSGDLELIVMKTLEKERDRRYAAANSLGGDVERFLRLEPVQARAPGAFYLAKQFARRHRSFVAGSVAVLIALLMGLGASTMLFLREREARAVADAELQKSREVSRFLKDMLASAGVSKSLGRDATMMREVLDQTAERIGAERGIHPEVELELRGAIAAAYMDIDEYETAELHERRALELVRTRRGGGDDPELANAIIDYAASLEKLGRFREVIPLAEEGVAMLERTVGPEHPDTGDALSELAWALMKSGRAAEALKPAERSFSIWESHPLDVRLKEAPKSLATVYMHLKRGAEAEATYRRERAALEKQHGLEHPDLVVCFTNFGMQLVNNGKFEEAETVLLESIRQGRKFFGDRNPYEDHSRARLAIIAARRGEVDLQLEHLREGVSVAFRVYPKGHVYRREPLNNLVRALESIVKKLEASAAQDGTLEARRAELQEARLRLEEER